MTILNLKMDSFNNQFHPQVLMVSTFDMALTFDDVLLLPSESEVLPAEVTFLLG